ncbi:MAG: hypothetical protein HY960_01390 [Ignavibacteriae bacterium]|nr:hypothetical protein [Ignavibacteriota bacterium]
MTLTETITNKISQLEPEKQSEVLEFLNQLNNENSKFGSGKSLLGFAGLIEPSDLEIMKKEIEDGCEQIAEHEW